MPATLHVNSKRLVHALGTYRTTHFKPLKAFAGKLALSPDVYGSDVFAHSYFSARDFPNNMAALSNSHTGDADVTPSSPSTATPLPAREMPASSSSNPMSNEGLHGHGGGGGSLDAFAVKVIAWVRAIRASLDRRRWPKQPRSRVRVRMRVQSGT